jgi:hypothetical protein
MRLRGLEEGVVAGRPHVEGVWVAVIAIVNFQFIAVSTDGIEDMLHVLAALNMVGIPAAGKDNT